MIVTLIQVLFVLIGLAMVVACFFPNWNFSQPVVVGTLPVVPRSM